MTTILDSAAVKASPYLEVHDAQGFRCIHFDAGEISIGRHPESVLFLNHSDLSRRHCVVRHLKHGCLLRDLGSRNGTKVNGQPASSRLLVHGDLIRVGRTKLRFVDRASRDRRAAFELLEFNESLRDILLDKPSISAIRQALRGGHFISLREFGLQLVVDGETSFEEIDRISPVD